MRKLPFLIFLLFSVAVAFGSDEKNIPSMPAAVSGNAVASVRDGLEIFSFMGVGPRKTWDDVTNQVYVLDLGHPKWREGRTVPDVNVYEPGAHRWSRAKDIPVPVDNAAVGETHGRFIYLIGGRSPNGPVNNVPGYDGAKDSWTQATPFPGTPVFGLAGGIAGESVVVIDGAQKGPAGGPRYVACEQAWLGKIDHKDPTKIEWSKLPPHPGTARFDLH